MRKVLTMTAGLVLLLAMSGLARAEMSSGQTVFVPCYSQTYHGPKNRPLDLTITLAVRNIDTKRPITVDSVDYHRTDGRLVRRYLEQPMQLGPLAARVFLVDQADSAGGTAASFLVRWRADRVVNAPVVEAVMITSSSSLGVSFVSQGVEVQE